MRKTLAILSALVLLTSTACVSTPYSYLGSSFPFLGSTDTTSTTDTSGTSSFFDSGGRANVDPCSESQSRKFVRISMQNLASDAYIHYFLVLIAYVNGDTYNDGAVCQDDVQLYTSFGYTEIDEGEEVAFGNYCIQGPALVYFHESGQFRSGGATSSGLASAIAPAQGTSGSFDRFFTSSGATVPVPNLILFHNPDTGDGQSLKISSNATDPCNEGSLDSASADCLQDAFYYVDENDLPTGTNTLGVGSNRRVPSEIQGTGCECTGFQNPYQELAPSGTSASNAECNEFLRGGRIQYVFIREDTNPAYPQLLWRVTDQSGAEVHNYDSRADIP